MSEVRTCRDLPLCCCAILLVARRSGAVVGRPARLGPRLRVGPKQLVELLQVRT